MRGRRALRAGTTIVAVAWAAAPAHADHHEMKIAEVYPGSDLAPNVEYVQLQMTSPGQSFLDNTNSTVTLQAANGAIETVGLDADVANGQTGRRVLVGSDLTSFGVSPDFVFSNGNFLNRVGGAACFVSGVFGPIDCVSWGNFSGSTSDPTGGNTSAITDTMAIVRRAPACGAGLIDTNNPSNWTEEAPDPFNNAAPAATGSPCPNTTITKQPKKKTTKRRAKFEFTATQGVDEFQCKLDNAPFKDCDSPFRKRVKLGKHKFKVAAEGDDSPASYSWKVVKKKRN